MFFAIFPFARNIAVCISALAALGDLPRLRLLCSPSLNNEKEKESINSNSNSNTNINSNINSNSNPNSNKNSNSNSNTCINSSSSSDSNANISTSANEDMNITIDGNNINAKTSINASVNTAQRIKMLLLAGGMNNIREAAAHLKREGEVIKAEQLCQLYSLSKVYLL